jgi:hypothetical protein
MVAALRMSETRIKRIASELSEVERALNRSPQASAYSRGR